MVIAARAKFIKVKADIALGGLQVSVLSHFEQHFMNNFF